MQISYHSLPIGGIGTYVQNALGGNPLAKIGQIGNAFKDNYMLESAYYDEPVLSHLRPYNRPQFYSDRSSSYWDSTDSDRYRDLGDRAYSELRAGEIFNL